MVGALPWRDTGGARTALVTMGRGFDAMNMHPDHVRRVADALKCARLMA
jgi:hypothetical protein